MSEQPIIFLSDDKIFYTIEGEGEYAGMPSVFMRVSMCNLTCKGFASADSPHGCDSFVSWSVKNRFTVNDILDILDNEGHTRHLRDGAIWKITGGEPLIQQKALLELVREFSKRNGFIPKIDFETNATIQPLDEWSVYQATYTTSPKLSNNGDSEEKRYKPTVLRWHVRAGSGFKFVINDLKDLDEVYRKYIEHPDVLVPKHRVWLMPCCGSRAEHTNKAAMVAELCKKHDLKFSPRLQLVIWDKALKV
jgi:6-pyruvoyltetrahydropterin 2'-reductase